MRLTTWLGVGIISVLVAACTGIVPVTPGASPQAETIAPAATAPAEATHEEPAATSGMTYNDPFAYCAAVGTSDTPDERYTGPAVSVSIVQGLRTAMETPDAPADLFAEGRAFWRCMDSRVYACVVGANIPCMEKADVSQEPTAEMAQFCQENPGAEVIPAYVTGRATIYAWRCENSTPTAGEAVAEVDEQGYNQNFWYELPAP
ncbi:MAG: hypothetical protein KJZ93_06965 [Caldilineaceae bacterium]|nr:hypothetical protein [Caldilineaceae bacterium]